MTWWEASRGAHEQAFAAERLRRPCSVPAAAPGLLVLHGDVDCRPRSGRQLHVGH